MKPFRCPTSHDREGVGGVALDSEDRSAEGTLWAGCVMFSGYRSKQCQD